MAWSDFTTGELALGMVISAVICVGSPIGARYLNLELEAGKVKPETGPKELPIAVKPVMDELPLLKLGGKKMKPKLPDMWQIKPEAIKRMEAASAPSPDAKDDPTKIPESKVAEGDAAAPPPDAEIAKEVDEDIKDLDAGEVEPTAEGEGSPDGVKEGTETDPLKARAVSLYRIKIAAWFSSRFHQPASLPCSVVGGLRASVSATVGGDRSVTGFTITSPSGNAAFDAKVREAMQSTVGQQLPPPPKNYPDILDSSVFPVFAGDKSRSCAKTEPPPKDPAPADPKPDPKPEPAPEGPAPEAPSE